MEWCPSIFIFWILVFCLRVDFMEKLKVTVVGSYMEWCIVNTFQCLEAPFDCSATWEYAIFEILEGFWIIILYFRMPDFIMLFLLFFWMRLPLMAIQTVSMLERFLTKLARYWILDTMHGFIMSTKDSSDHNHLTNRTGNLFFVTTTRHLTWWHWLMS